MKGKPEERAIELAKYILENKATVRQTAFRFGISKSTVHKDITAHLKNVNPILHNEVKELMQINKSQRHIRGGMATKQKYLKKKKQPITSCDKLYFY